VCLLAPERLFRSVYTVLEDSFSMSGQMLFESHGVPMLYARSGRATAS
jgi:hypothetical protein